MSTSSAQTMQSNFEMVDTISRYSERLIEIGDRMSNAPTTQIRAYQEALERAMTDLERAVAIAETAPLHHQRDSDSVTGSGLDGEYGGVGPSQRGVDDGVDAVLASAEERYEELSMYEEMKTRLTKHRSAVPTRKSVAWKQNLEEVFAIPPRSDVEKLATRMLGKVKSRGSGHDFRVSKREIRRVRNKDVRDREFLRRMDLEFMPRDLPGGVEDDFEGDLETLAAGLDARARMVPTVEDG